MTREYFFRRKCDRCGNEVEEHFEGEDARNLPGEYTLHKDWAQINGESYEQLDICPACKLSFRNWKECRE